MSEEDLDIHVLMIPLMQLMKITHDNAYRGEAMHMPHTCVTYVMLLLQRKFVYGNIENTHSRYYISV
ncbi:hypothetical protein MAR_002844 [Mya arenaria]|uniref:Uncharacterized protein n=1 Tax=Mya arenaria TaxID=6604 RepID=A0ABY7GDK6_MYAAR|nr:hypothetical protein MAR_002844 [Mya arenaria]